VTTMRLEAVLLWLSATGLACGDDAAPRDAGVEDAAGDDGSAECPAAPPPDAPCFSPGRVCAYPIPSCGTMQCLCTDGSWRCVGGHDCDTGADVDAATADVPPDALPEVPPPACDPVPGSAYAIAFLPGAPWVGGSTRVSVTGPDPLTHVAIEAVGPGSSPVPVWIEVTGTGPYTWSWSVVFPAAGVWCVTFRADPGGTVYQRAPVTVSAEMPRTAAFKVVSNHQWTCEEEYTWAINVDTIVLDETGAPLPGVRVLVEHAPCETATDHPPPTEVVTGEDGTVRWENYNPRCFFHERVAEAPSDTAIEIYTGIWEDQDDGAGGRCNYCSTYAENVWGHWSYTITFRRTPGATELCEVPTDHAGQARCSPLLHWEEPAACTPL